MRYAITVTRYEQEIATDVNGPYLTGNNIVASVETTICADRAELLRELEAHGATAAERRVEDGYVMTHTRYRREWSIIEDQPAADEPLPAELETEADKLVLSILPIAAGMPEQVRAWWTRHGLDKRETISATDILNAREADHVEALRRAS
jgi:hypothetical protein